jgi:hypothetical protein
MSAAEGAEYLVGLHGDVMVDVAVSHDGVFSGDVRKAVSTSVHLSDFLYETTDLHVAQQDHEAATNEPASLRLYLAQCQIASEGAGDVPPLPKLSKSRGDQYVCVCVCVRAHTRPPLRVCARVGL